MRIYLIGPVRHASQEMVIKLNDRVQALEMAGHTVYYPARDTRQDASELEIAAQNRDAIVAADLVLFTWDGESEGCLFDLGVAFALEKMVQPLPSLMPALTEEKSFQRFVVEYYDAVNALLRHDDAE